MMGLDPVKLGQFYLALYSVYATHMGQGKEAAQVAMKYTISDLRKEAEAKDSMPPFSPVALIPTVNTVNHYVDTFQSLVRYLSGAAKCLF